MKFFQQKIFLFKVTSHIFFSFIFPQFYLTFLPSILLHFYCKFKLNFISFLLRFHHNFTPFFVLILLRFRLHFISFLTWFSSQFYNIFTSSPSTREWIILWRSWILEIWILLITVLSQLDWLKVASALIWVAFWQFKLHCSRAFS